MAFGILETKTAAEHVPGTSQISEPEEFGGGADLKKSTSHTSAIVLIPQPSNNPNDPLNWPLWQRDMILVLTAFCSNIAVGGIGPMVSTITVPILTEFDTDFQHVSLLIGYQLVVVAGMAPFVSAAARKWGKRPTFLLSLVALLAGSLICAAAPSYNVMLAGRLVQGLGTAAFESVSFSMVGDMYFVHQRGSRMSFYTIAAVGWILFPGLLAGVIAERTGWRWAFWVLCVFLGIALVAQILIGWETTWVRQTVHQQAASANASKDALEKGSLTMVEQVGTSPDPAMKRDSLIRRMRPWTGTIYDHEPLWRSATRPFMLVINPAVAWVVFMQSFTQLWSVVISIILAQAFAPPPYNLNTAQLGYLGAGPLVGGLLASFACHLVSDRMAMAIARRNNGVFEPEFRLLLIAVAPLFSSIGYFLFGKFASEGKSPILVSFLWGVAFASTQIICTSCGVYLVEAYREIDVDAFVVSMTAKNLLFFGFSYFINEWLAEWGIENVFYFIGAIMLILTLSTIPVYIYGKRIRQWWYSVDRKA